jgi:hypothetical protein
MKKLVTYIILIFMLTDNGIVAEAVTKNAINKDTKSNLYETTMKQDILCMMMAYPEHVTDIKLGDKGMVYLILKSGKMLLYDDKKNKNFEQKLENPDIQDMMEQIYPLNSITQIMDENYDPGRFRVNTLLKEVYGGTKDRVEAKLTGVNVGYGSLRFNGVNKASDALKNVMIELMPLAKIRRDIRNNVIPCSGTFNYRLISGTNRLSAHSFGIAIDLAVNKKDYWKWASKKQGTERLASYPKEIAEIFEKNYFIWGGKWNHFDIMHFEYRPEIIMKAKYFGNKNNLEKPWYDGVNSEDNTVRNYINNIEKVFI